MNLLSKIKNKLVFMYRCHIQRDFASLEFSRWFKDKGDETLRLNYPLTPASVVFDLGGYHGDFAAVINKRYGSSVFVFEPVLEFYKLCVARFDGNKKIICFNYGLSSADGWLNIGLAENASSLVSPHAHGEIQQVQIRSVVDCIRELNIDQIDLMKINIEGGEFDVVPAIIESGDIKKVLNLQVQFHDFVDNAVQQRAEIRIQLSKTHVEMWNYDFVWESWKLKAVIN